MGKVERREIRVVKSGVNTAILMSKIPLNAVFPGIAKGQMSRVKDTLSIYSKSIN